MRERIGNILSKLRNNETTFYNLILENQTEENFGPILYAMRGYFSKEDIKSLIVEKSDRTVCFDSKNKYLNHVLTSLFRNAEFNTATDLMAFLKSDTDAPEALVEGLFNTIIADGTIITPVEQLNNIQLQIIASGKYTKEALQHFAPDQDSEAVLKNGFSFAFNFEYKPSYMLLEDEAKYLSWTLTAIFAKLSKELLDYIPASHSILNITLQEQVVGAENQEDCFAFDFNLKNALMALNTTVCLEAPAYLICSNGHHWATVALVPIDGELRIFKFDSNGTTMADGFIAQLSSLIESTDLFTSVHNCVDLSQPVQYDMNCGVATAAFISVLNSLLGSNTVKPIEDIIQAFPDRYKMLGLDPKNLKETTEKLVRESLYYGLGMLSECKDKAEPLFNYDRESLYFGWLDLSGQRRNLCNFFNSISTHSFPSCPPLEETQNSLAMQFLYMSCTILTYPLNTLIAVCDWVAFRVYCAISEEPLKAEATRFCEKYSTWAQIKGNESQVETLFSQDLLDLTGMNQSHGM